jgi:hypothetical protein
MKTLDVDEFVDNASGSMICPKCASFRLENIGTTATHNTILFLNKCLDCETIFEKQYAIHYLGCSMVVDK